MRLVVDTGVFSAVLSSRRRSAFEQPVTRLAGNQLFLASPTVAELRFGALVAGWGEGRRTRLEEAIEATTVIPITDALLTAIADLRYACRIIGHPLAARAHSSDLWIAASAIHIDASLVTRDEIFNGVAGLDVV